MEVTNFQPRLLGLQMTTEVPMSGFADNGVEKKIEQLESRLRCQLIGRIRGFRLALHTNAGVILHGQAETYYAKQLAQHAVMRATDMSIYQNAIEVAYDLNSPKTAAGGSCHW